MRGFKGISPLISVVLLIAIGVVMAGMLFNWGPSLTRSQTSLVGNKSSLIVECNPPLIEDVYIDFPSNISRMYVRGGQGGAHVIEAKIISVTGDEAPLVNASDVPFNISAGKLKILQFNVTNKINSCANFSQGLITSCITDRFVDRPKCN